MNVLRAYVDGMDESVYDFLRCIPVVRVAIRVFVVRNAHIDVHCEAAFGFISCLNPANPFRMKSHLVVNIGVGSIVQIQHG